MQANPTRQSTLHNKGSPNDSRFFEGTDDAYLFDVRCYATTGNGPVVVPVPASRPQEAAEFFRHGTRRGLRAQMPTTRTLPPGQPDTLRESTTFFCNSSGVRLQGCSLYAIKDCQAGIFEVPEKPSESYLEALSILREPIGNSSKTAKDPFSVTATRTERVEYHSTCDPDFYGSCIVYVSHYQRLDQ
ncbi:hypothetical protein VKT23_019502 [Stygiomarasmius scandens]|uniref:Uncharacterized protein n=1 Tax=Marasmiellus scandens TaxID=2682957 RepID=A0ABR1ILD8_9AGAR